MTIRYDGQVAIITGAGGGLGRAYALALAERGARIVVNDLGGERDGVGHSDMAEAVAAEIRSLGGDAIADPGSVTNSAAMAVMAQKAIDAWGRIDILINNAGILRDRSFAKMEEADFRAVIDVHLHGTANATRAVWNHMRAQNYGRILMTTSGSGLYGNFGQANYSTAKLGLVALARTLHLEGARHDIRVNSIAPLAGTRMSADLMPEETFETFSVDNVVPGALFLVSRNAPSGTILGAGGGYYHGAWITITEGCALPEADRTPEGIAAHWQQIMSRKGEMVPQSAAQQATNAMAKLEEL